MLAGAGEEERLAENSTLSHFAESARHFLLLKYDFCIVFKEQSF